MEMAEEEDETSVDITPQEGEMDVAGDRSNAAIEQSEADSLKYLLARYRNKTIIATNSSINFNSLWRGAKVALQLTTYNLKSSTITITIFDSFVSFVVLRLARS